MGPAGQWALWASAAPGEPSEGIFTFGPGRGTWAGTEVNTWDTVDQGKGAVFDEPGYCRDGDRQCRLAHI